MKTLLKRVIFAVFFASLCLLASRSTTRANPLSLSGHPSAASCCLSEAQRPPTVFEEDDPLWQEQDRLYQAVDVLTQ